MARNDGSEIDKHKYDYLEGEREMVCPRCGGTDVAYCPGGTAYRPSAKARRTIKWMCTNGDCLAEFGDNKDVILDSALVSARVSGSLVNRIDELARIGGITRSEWISRVLVRESRLNEWLVKLQARQLNEWLVKAKKGVSIKPSRFEK